MARMIGPRRSRRRRYTFLALLGALVAAGLLAASGGATVTDNGTVDVQVPNKTTSVVDAQTAQGAFVSYFGDSDTTFGSSGTGTFNPFVRLQGSPTEQGYNTNGTTQFDTKVGTWTHAIKVSEIPQRPCPQAAPTETCFELFNDINENNSTPYVSLNKVEVYYTSSATLTGYPFSGNATLQYAFNGNILIHDVNQGSGRGDLRYDIPVGSGTNQVPLPANCNYGNPNCTTYFVLYSQWGTTGTLNNINYNSDGGFEEWKVKVYPVPPDISVAKTPDGGSINAGGNAVFTIVTTNNGPTTATGVTLTDTLPTSPGSGLSWTVGGTDAASCSITAGVLNCNFGDVPFPGSKTVTLTSSTTAANCGTINNTGTVSSTNEGPNTANNTDSGSITVNCAAIAILKESSKSGNPLVSVAGAVFHVTGPNSYAADVTDNGSGDEDSTVGAVCISGLAPGTYTVSETTPPTGYGSGTAVDNTSTATSGTNCTANKPTTADSAVFTDPPLGNIGVTFTDGGSGETHASIVCAAGTTTISADSENGAADPAFDDTNESFSNLAPGTYNCQVVIDP
jgi:uncharacterized repeat protein (TIGR01451 family)